MERPQREEFILDVRRSARALQRPSVEADSETVDTDAISKILKGAARWLTPKIVEHYDPHDFASWTETQQENLRRAVDEFREVARQVPPDKPATMEQFTEGRKRFCELTNV